MTIFIVMVNGAVDEVFDNHGAAVHHARQKNRKWSVTSIIEKEVLSI